MILDNLNPQQLQAVTTDWQYTLVLAGAGSGKTRVLTSRMAWLMQTRRCPASGLLAVTFTNKAAKEMRARLAAMLPINTRSLWVGTFHGLCNRLLRAHTQEAGLPRNFLILDSTDQLSAIKRLHKAMNLNNESMAPKSLQHFINRQKEQGLRAQALTAHNAHEQQEIEFYANYEAQCLNEGVVDFPELLLRCYELLQNNHILREHYQERFKHILIDEFQDTNDMQFKWLQLLAGTQNSIFAVGDDDQSIYAFRGANVGNMIAFERNYAKGQVIRLEQNYRSTAHILNSANHLIKNNSTRLGKDLWTAQGEGEPIRIFELEDEQDEAKTVVAEIQRWIVEQALPRREIAILYRSNAQSRALEHVISKQGIPYKIYGGTRFYERQEIKHAMAYLRLAADINDNSSFMRVVNFPARGIGTRTLENLQTLAEHKQSSLAAAIADSENAVKNKLAPFLKIIKEIRDAAQELPLNELIAHAIEVSGLKHYYQSQREGQERLDNLQELINAGMVFQNEEGFGQAKALENIAYQIDAEQEPEQSNALLEFLSHASLESGDNQAEAHEDAIQLMTIHAAKGLEFDVVFLVGLEQGLFPHSLSVEDPKALDEERRLMYVAITRARKQLYMSWAHCRMLYGQSRYSKASMFFEELPESSLQWLTPKYTGHSGRQGMNSDDFFSKFSASSSRSTTSASRSHASSGVEVNGQFFKVGQTVRHSHFGQGVIMQISHQAADVFARIFFTQVGEKNISLSIAKLEIL
ncbi:UvrD-helicase domain-containing protein [Brackiella oedipodis]|uniref:UvrD-helicase domain-containing protein n=1 Tax=Brackiella oedipodis TaxID=124225 RepID=UPI0004908622|nr:UvrD-helicase domain-containing protein [Brackiella oedipodis]